MSTPRRFCLEDKGLYTWQSGGSVPHPLAMLVILFVQANAAADPWASRGIHKLPMEHCRWAGVCGAWGERGRGEDGRGP